VLSRISVILWAILLLAGGMFCLPAAIWAIYLPSLRQGLPNPVPGYEQILLGIAVFCGTWKWFLALLVPPTVAALLAIGLTDRRPRARR
jgi:hypothetical protein